MLSFFCNFNLVVTLLIGSYLLGSIPFGLILTRMAGKGDIRKFGSGNIGATNVLRRSGKFIALLTLLLDGLKGAVAIMIAQKFCNDYLLMMLVGLSVILGHIFSIFLRFKGGKGVATSIAVFLVLAPEVGVVTCIIWLMILALIRISAVSALISFAITPIICYFITYDTRLVIIFSLISIIVILRHSENIKQLMQNKN
ncbi:MAG: glycerol-3-phosphate 1-O-acyltransferase PlsY [Alphaproteobacteria bacterium]|nr:glycerol-3-phosphate 1-O-acyltransferase PlsY [Alphaproteobacteria bacterium]